MCRCSPAALLHRGLVRVEDHVQARPLGSPKPLKPTLSCFQPPGFLHFAGLMENKGHKRGQLGSTATTKVTRSICCIAGWRGANYHGQSWVLLFSTHCLGTHKD